MHEMQTSIVYMPVLRNLCQLSENYRLSHAAVQCTLEAVHSIHYLEYSVYMNEYSENKQ